MTAKQTDTPKTPKTTKETAERSSKQDKFFNLLKDFQKIHQLGDMPEAFMLLKNDTIVKFNGIMKDEQEWCQMTTMGLAAFNAIGYGILSDANVRDLKTGEIKYETVMASGAFLDPDIRKCFMSIKKDDGEEMVDDEQEWTGSKGGLLKVMSDSFKGMDLGSPEYRIKEFMKVCKRRGWEFGVTNV